MAGPVSLPPEAALGMAEIAIRPEVVPARGPAAATPEAALLEEARKSFHAGRIEDTLKVIKGDIVPFTPQDQERVLVMQLSSNRDASGKKIAPTSTTSRDEVRRISTARADVSRTRDLLEKGVIDPTMRDTLSTFLATTNPNLYGDTVMTPTDRQALVEQMMKSDNYRHVLSRIFNERMNPKMAEQLFAEMAAKEQAVRELEGKEKVAAARLSTAPSAADITTAKTTWDAAKAALAPIATDKIDLETAITQRNLLEPQIMAARKNAAAHKAEHDIIEAEITATDAAIATHLADTGRMGDTEYNRLQGLKNNFLRNRNYILYKTNQDTVDSYKGLTDTITRLRPIVDPLVAAEVSAKEAYEELVKGDRSMSPEKKAQLQQELDALRNQLADARDTLEFGMIQFHRDVTHMAQDAAAETVGNSLESLKTTYKEEAGKKKEKDKTEQDRLAEIAAGKMSNIWKRATTDRGRFGWGKRWLGATNLRTYRADVGLSIPYMNELLTRGNEGLLLKIEGSSDAVLTGGLVGMTPAEKDAFREKLKDGAFRTQLADRLSGEAVRDYLVAGGELNQGVYTAMAGSALGTKLIDSAVSQADTIVKAYSLKKDDLKALQELTKVSHSREALKAHMAKHPWIYGFLLTLFAAGVLSVPVAGLGHLGASAGGMASGLSGGLSGGAGWIKGGLSSFIYGASPASAG